MKDTTEAIAATPPAARRTQNELLKLRVEWENDPCWDIEDTGGFEAHREELLVYRHLAEERWQEEAESRLRTNLYVLGLDDTRQNRALATYIEGLERRIERLQAAFDDHKH